MAVDTILASLHHIFIFMLFAMIAAELVLVRPGLGPDMVRRLAGIDRAYGGLAVAVILAGVARVIWGAKGWEFYVGNHVFWAKMVTFGIVGLLSIPPTMRFIAWRKKSAADPAYAPPAEEVARVRRFVHLQAGLFLLIPIFAAMMARGIGY